MIAPNADVDPNARVAPSARIWGYAQIREDAVVGEECVIGRGAYIDKGVIVGDRCKVQNQALLYEPAVLEDGVFVGPAAVLTNDSFPRAVNPDGSLKSAADWNQVGVTLRTGASIGARAVVLGGVEIGSWALVAAGSVVTRDVAPHALVAGTPARRIGWVGTRGVPLVRRDALWVDDETGESYEETSEGIRLT